MINQYSYPIVFRADGDSQIGLGHIMRCVAIAEMIEKSDPLFFAIQEPSQQVLQILHQASFQVLILPKTADYQVDVDNFVAELNGNEIVILDGYCFKEKYQKLVKQRCWKLLAIDDLAAWHQYADIVINHGGNAQITDYETEPYTNLLLGTQYALIRDPFLEAGRTNSLKKVTSFSPQYIFINLGGADPENISYRLVEILLGQPSVRKLVVVLGAANQHTDSFSQSTQQRVQVCQSLTSEQMVKVIQLCDLAIVSCSTISYEVATIGKPFIGILTADNQVSLRDFYVTNQLALRILEKNFTDYDVTSALLESTALVNTNLTSQQYFFDGKSGERIALLFRTLLASQ